MVTKREVLTKVVNGVALNEEELGVVKKMIEQLDYKSSKPTKAQKENELIKVELAKFMGDNTLTAREIADGTGYSVNKVSALLRAMNVEKIPGEKSKDAPKYKLIAEDDPTEQVEQSNCYSPTQWGRG